MPKPETTNEYIPWPDVVPTGAAKLILAQIRSNQYLLAQRLPPDAVTTTLERIIQLALDAYKSGKPMGLQ